MKVQGTQNSQDNKKKKRIVGGLKLADFKTCKHGHKDNCNWIDSSEINGTI